MKKASILTWFSFLFILIVSTFISSEKSTGASTTDPFIIDLIDRVEDSGISTEFINGSLKVRSIGIEKKEKSYDDIFKNKYYEEGSDWQLTFNALKETYGNEKSKRGTRNNEEVYFDGIFYDNLINEIYVVDLINGSSDVKTTLDSWKYNLQFLIDNYDEIINSDNVDINIINNYIETYLANLAVEDYPDEKEIEISVQPMSTTTYKNNVRNYINKYWDSINSSKYADYNGYDGDCANFASQCLHAGGKPMKGTPSTAAVAQNSNNWFSYSNTRNSIRISSTWRGANMFKWHWLDNSIGYRFYRSNTPPQTYAAYGDVGDAISITNANKAGIHTMVVYQKNVDELWLAGHTANTKSAKMSDRISQFGGGIYLMKM